MEYVLEVLQDVDMVIMAVVVGIIVSAVVEGIKAKIQIDLTEEDVRHVALVLGWVGGMVAMYITGGDFTSFSIIGIAGGIWSTGIYEFIGKRLGISNKVNTSGKDD